MLPERRTSARPRRRKRRRDRYATTARRAPAVRRHRRRLKPVERGLHLEVSEFADMLGVFSVVVAEDDDIEGDILAVWAGIMKQSL